MDSSLAGAGVCCATASLEEIRWEASHAESRGWSVHLREEGFEVASPEDGGLMGTGKQAGSGTRGDYCPAQYDNGNCPGSIVFS